MKCMWKKIKSSKQQSLHLLLIKWISRKTYQDRWPFPLHRPDNRHQGGRSHVWRTCGWCCFPVRSWWRNRTDTPQCPAPHPPTPHHLHPQNLQLKGHKNSGRVHLHWQVLSNWEHWINKYYQRIQNISYYFFILKNWVLKHCCKSRYAIEASL